MAFSSWSGSAEPQVRITRIITNGPTSLLWCCDSPAVISVLYMREWLTGFLQWSTKHNSLTRPGVHCGWCTLVATFHGRNANAVLCAWKQVWDTKRDREAGTNLTHNVAGTKKIVIIIIITDSASRSCPRAKCTSITLSFFSWQPQLARHRWWGLGKFTCSIVVISEEISFFLKSTAQLISFKSVECIHREDLELQK